MENIIYKDKYEELYFSYLSYYDKVWDEKTYSSESSKMKTILKTLRVSGLQGMAFYNELKAQGYKPYTIKALFSTAARMYAHGQLEQRVSGFNNPFKDFMIRSQNVFRNAYKPERLKVTFDIAKERILTIEDASVREFCLALLQSGLRIDEAYKVDYSTSSVTGKGDKQRFVVFNYRGTLPSKYLVRKALKEIGLKPHSLRKLLATKLSRSSELSRADLMEIMGWSSIDTADKYFQPLHEEQLKARLLDILKD